MLLRLGSALLLLAAIGRQGSAQDMPGTPGAPGEPAAGAEEAPKIDFRALGEAFVAEHCAEGATAPCPLEDVLARDFLRLDVGPFELWAPRGMVADKDAIAQLKGVVGALADAVDTWCAWQGVAPDPERAKLWDAWIKGWKARKPSAEALESSELLDALGAEEEERAAVLALRALAREGDALALKPKVPERDALRLILAPKRKDLMRWVGYAGLLDPAQQAELWRAEVDSWAQFWVGWNLVLALEYQPWTGFDPTFETGQPMERLGEGVTAQHVVQQSFVALLHAARPGTPASRIDGALAMLLSIRALGENNTIEGAGGVSSSGANATPYERFVPGGNSAGGTLPGRSAAALSGLVENRWRKGHGADGFAGPLRAGQAAGAKAVKKQKEKDPLAHFVLLREDGTGEHLIHAPFFGPHADEQAYPPPDYLVDYAEFYRAYKTCFLHWIAAHGDPKDPAGKWSAVVRGLATLSAERTFDDLVQEVYGAPISAKDGSTDSLEWRFLRALPKLK